MNGEAFGLRPFDLRRRRSRTFCEDCGCRLLYDADALGIWSRMNAEDRATAGELLEAGGTIYGCPRCGMVGAFTAWMCG